MSEHTCKLPDCDRKHLALELCGKHYQRFMRTGTTEPRPRLTAEQRKANALESKRRHREANRERLNVERRAYREAHLEHELARCREYQRANRARTGQVTLAWRVRNRERVAAVNAAWYASNREWSAAKSATRRARIKATTVARVDYAAVVARWGMRCHLCRGAIRSRRDLHIDHVVPLARGGAHTYANLRPAHAYCNRSKGARPVRTVQRRYDLAA